MTVREVIDLFVDDFFPLEVYDLDKDETVFNGYTDELDDMDIEEAEVMSIDNFRNDGGNKDTLGKVTVNISNDY